MIPATSWADQGNGTAWLAIESSDGDVLGALDVSLWKAKDRPCDTCDGAGRLPSPWSPEDFENEVCRCPDCIDGRRTFSLDVECSRCLPDARGYELTGGAEWKLPDGRWVRACYDCGDPAWWASPGTGVRSLLVSVVPGMVLPLLDVLPDANGYPPHAPQRFAYASRRGLLRVVDLADPSDTYMGKAPADAKPGGFAVLVNWRQA